MLIRKNYRGYIFALLRRRVDFVFTISQLHLLNLQNQINIKPNKIRIIRPAFFSACENGPLIIKDRHELQQIRFVGMKACLKKRQLPYLLTVLRAISVATIRDADYPIKLMIFTDESDTKHSILKQLFDKVDELKLNNKVFFFSAKNVDATMQSLDVWIDSSDALDDVDYVRTALSLGVPVLLPRIISGIEILEESSKKVGELYSLGDVRELAVKLIKILDNQSKYISNISTCYESLTGPEFMHKRLLELKSEYRRLIKIRRRFYREDKNKQ